MCSGHSISQFRRTLWVIDPIDLAADEVRAHLVLLALEADTADLVNLPLFAVQEGIGQEVWINGNGLLSLWKACSGLLPKAACGLRC